MVWWSNAVERSCHENGMGAVLNVRHSSRNPAFRMTLNISFYRNTVLLILETLSDAEGNEVSSRATDAENDWLDEVLFLRLRKPHEARPGMRLRPLISQRAKLHGYRWQ